MKASRVKLLLWATTAFFAAGACLAVAWAALGPYDDSSAADLRPVPRRVAGPPGFTDPPIAAFAKVWDGPLGRPLSPPRATPVVPSARPVTAAAVPPAVKLIGTVVEDGYSMAIFAQPDGKVEWKRVGEASGGAEVLRIEADRVMVRHNGEPVVLRVERVEKGRKG
jgi:hypothetical protein